MMTVTQAHLGHCMAILRIIKYLLQQLVGKIFASLMTVSILALKDVQGEAITIVELLFAVWWEMRILNSEMLRFQPQSTMANTDKTRHVKRSLSASLA